MNRKIVSIMMAVMFSAAVMGCGGKTGISEAAVEETTQKIKNADTLNKANQAVRGGNTEKEVQASTGKKQMNGWNESTNRSYTINNFSFSVPSYFGEPNDDNNWYIETGRRLSMLGVYSNGTISKTEPTNDEIDSALKGFIDGANSGEFTIDNNSISTTQYITIAGCKGGYQTYDMIYQPKNGQKLYLKGSVMILCDSSIGKMTTFGFTQSDEASCDYSLDYQNIINHITYVQTSDSSVASSTSDSTSVTPELKEFWDSYESIVDEYIALTEKYKNNPTDMQVLSDYLTILDKYNEFAQKANEYSAQEDEMSTADLNYYLDVTTRVSKKLLQAAASGSTE